MKITIFGQAFIALCLAVAAWPVTADPNPNRPPPMHSNTPMPPALFTRLLQAQDDERDAKLALQAKNYASAEAGFRNVIADFPSGMAYYGLAETLAAQGKTAEALQAYWQLFHPDAHQSWGGSYFPQAELEYAVLLNRTGHWAEAVAMYEKALPDVSDQGMKRINVHFDPATPQPAEMEAAAHIGIGLEAIWAGGDFDASKSERAFQEYGKALKLMPEWTVANYYYGYGWQRLDPKDQAKLAANPGQREAVKATLEKAAKLGTGDVQKAAVTELQNLR